MPARVPVVQTRPPITKGAINQLLPIYATLMVYEPINVLLLAGESRMTNKK